jgi:hypothetical protein
VSQFDLVGTTNAQSTGAVTGTPLTGDPKLGPLQNNGGPTQTMALGNGSPAINAGDPNCEDLNGTAILTDQRGAPRPHGSACDIGAYEVAPPTISAPTANPIGATSATITASIDSNAQDTTVAVRYGATIAYGSTTTAQDIGSANSATAIKVSLTGLRPGSTYHAQVIATNADGSSASTDIAFTITKTPSLTKLAETAARWREGSALARISSSRARVGTTFSFTLDQTATVSFAFTHNVHGRRVNGTCRAQSKRNKHHAPCTAKVIAGSIKFKGHSGTNRVRFQGRISHSKRLAPGSYKLTVTATGTTGLRSSAHSLMFTIVKH